MYSLHRPTISFQVYPNNNATAKCQKRIKIENVQDSTSQQIFDLEKLVFLLVLASWW